jgi:hypothetical protein
MIMVTASTTKTGKSEKTHAQPDGEGRCDVCGNRYDKMLSVELEGVKRSFDCFECAIFAMAPTCRHCGVRVVGHGLEAGDALFCCAHCARQAGIEDLRDRA